MKPQNDSSANQAEGVNRKTCLKEFSAEDLKASLLNSYDEASIWEELVLTAQAMFEFVWNSELELPVRNAVYQLEKQFQFYRRLMELKG